MPLVQVDGTDMVCRFFANPKVYQIIEESDLQIITVLQIINHLYFFGQWAGQA